MPAILKVDPLDPDPAVIREAAEMIREGLVVAYPTDTLYGLAVDPRNAAAVPEAVAGADDPPGELVSQCRTQKAVPEQGDRPNAVGPQGVRKQAVSGRRGGVA